MLTRTPLRNDPGRLGKAFLLLGSILVLGAGCGGGTAVQLTDDYFAPLPPDPPRIQYLRSFNGSPDLKSGSTVLDYLAGAERTPEYNVKKPFSVAAWKGRIYVTDSFGLQTVSVFDLANNRFYLLGAKEGIARLRKPIHISVDDDGYKYVSDLIRRQIVVYGPDDSFYRTYGDGRSFLPVACAAHGSEVYVLDMEKDKVKSEVPGGEDLEIRRDQILVLDKTSGKPLRRIGRHVKGKGGFCFASFLTVDRLGNIYVSDAQNHRLVKLDSQGNVKLSFGTHGDRAGQFAFMKGVAVTRKGIIYVVDAGFQAVQAFDSAGTPLFAWGGARSPVAPMSLPAGICVDYDSIEYLQDYVAPDFTPEYLILVANQYSAKHRIAVYAYGKRRGVEYPPKDQIVTLEKSSSETLWRMDVVSPGSSLQGKRLVPDAAPQEGSTP